MKKIRTSFTVFFICLVSVARSEEGMWLPLLLEKLNEKQMKSLGMKISARDIYSINSGSLKDAILSIGGCTGEVISSQGLVLTNHHCGFGRIQSHSTLEHNYIRDGFWAREKGAELPNPGMTATFIVRIEEVTKEVLKGITDDMNEEERQSAIDKNNSEIIKTARKEKYQEATVRGFFEGNQYYLFISEVYRDVRLVGAPPSSIGNFGKDTDNWMWPRHTGDFSLFRIYAGPDNKPATFSENNIPYTPKRSLSISMDGVAEGDFTMVFGFPGRTTQYLASPAVEQIMNMNDPAKIVIREKALAIMDQFMRKNEQIKIQYASKYAGIQNSYKRWQGEVLGLTTTNALEKKRAYEKEFQKRVMANPAWKSRYGSVLKDLESAYTELKPLSYANDHFAEIVFAAPNNYRIELFAAAMWIHSLRSAYEKNGEKGYETKLKEVKGLAANFYKDYNEEVDRQLFEALMNIYKSNMLPEYQSPLFVNWLTRHGNDMTKAADMLYSGSKLTSAEKINKLLEQTPQALVSFAQKDAAVQMISDLFATFIENVDQKLNDVQGRISKLNRVYMQGQREVFSEKAFYPDANRTLRLTYGQVGGYQPRDAVRYDHYTYLDGVMDKYKPGDYEFDVPEKLRELYRAKDYGPYGSKGKMPVCFIAKNHTTGGNSGSPALDAYGNLVGLNFDRAWEGTMSDINYDPSICRNIMVDIRYVLFIVDKFAGAGHLVREMKLVHPKKK